MTEIQTAQAIFVVVRQDAEQTLVLGAYTSSDRALQVALEDIERQVSDPMNQVPTDEMVSEAQRLAGELISGEPEVTSQLDGCEFTWSLQVVTLNADSVSAL